MRKLVLLLTLVSYTLVAQSPLPVDTTNAWNLSWSDEFDYPDSELEDNWTSQNAASGGVVLCSRWRENSDVHDGILELKAIKETRGGQDWTCGNVWTKKRFHYGYYECRYKYAGASGTNNSFWMWPRFAVPEGEKAFELDVNEGHYPNIINTNIHNWTDKDEDGGHEDDPQRFVMGGVEPQPGYTHEFESPITTRKIRFSSTHGSHFHIGEFRVYEPNSAGYPAVETSETADTDVSGLVNLSRGRGVTFTASGQYVVSGRNTDPKNVADGNVAQTTWIAQAEGEKWLELEFATDVEVGCVQFTNGWKSGSEWKSLIYNYKLEYWDGIQWVTFSTFDTANGVDFSEEYHTYGLLWNERQIQFYFDGELVRSEPHTLCHSETNIFLSLAILDNGIAGAVTDDIDGTSMKVDYVRYYTPVATSILEASESSKVKVYPNPVKESFTIEGTAGFDKLCIMNIQGKKMIEYAGDLTPSFDVSHLAKGIYIYTLSCKDETIHGRFLKQ